MEFSVGISTDKDHPALWAQGLEPPGTGDAVFIPQNHINQGQVGGILHAHRFVNGHLRGKFADHTLQLAAVA